MDLALFDFDGTITTRETFVDFVKLAMPRWRWRVGSVLLAPLVVGYRCRLVSVSMLRAAVAWVAFKGVEVAALERAARTFRDDLVPGLMRDEAIRRLAWHRKRGDRIVVVSAGFDIALAPWCAANGFELVASRLESGDGVLTGRYLGKRCAGPEKCRRVRSELDLDAFDCIHAYGDTHEDMGLLALAHARTFQWQPA